MREPRLNHRPETAGGVLFVSTPALPARHTTHLGVAPGSVFEAWDGKTVATGEIEEVFDPGPAAD
jgi:hypothetical protein